MHALPPYDWVTASDNDTNRQATGRKGNNHELCGSWVWCSGETKKHKEALKGAGFHWSQNKKKWYWHHEEPGRKWRRGNTSMADIRRKYGSQVFNGSREETGFEKIGAAC